MADASVGQPAFYGIDIMLLHAIVQYEVMCLFQGKWLFDILHDQRIR